MKSIATLSDQYIGLQFRKDNGLPIDPTSIHFKGKVYTNPNTPFEFEINKGVLTNCVIKYNLVILHIVPNFKSGTVSIEGNRFTTPEDILGKYIKQELDISITANADVRNLQDYAIADVILYGDDIATQTIDPNEIKSIVDKYLALNLKGIVSPIIQNELSVDVTNAVTKAINNNLPNDISTEIAKVLSNKVDAEIVKQLSTKLDNAIKNANLAKNDLEDVDLAKLYDKGIDAKLAAADLSNVKADNFDRLLKANSAFIALENNQHPAVKGLTADEIKALFYTNRYEEVNAVDFTQSPFKDATTLLMVYQITSEGQNIAQVLPPYTSNQIIMIEVLYSKGITTGSVEIDVVQGEHMEGVTTKSSIIFKENSYAGYFIPLKNEQGWEFISHAKTQVSTIGASDEKGNIVPEVKNLKFKKPLFIEHDDDANETGIALGDVSFVFKDKIQNKAFKSKMLQSLDGSIRISAIPAGQDSEGNEIIDADLSVASKDNEEGIFAALGEDELINSKNAKERLYFGDLKVQGGQAVYQDLNTKSFVIQDISTTDDPNISGGTTFLAAVYFECSPFETATGITQDGNIQVGLMDDNNQFMTDIYGNPMFVQIDYKQGDKERKELYLGQIQAKAFTRVHFGIKCNFANEELISIGSKSCIMLQAMTKDSGYGNALAAFMTFTGYRINFDNKYYGLNSLNLARDLIYSEPEYEANNEDFYLGDGVHINIKSKAKIKIDNYQLIIKDNGVDLPIFSIYKRYNKIDTHLCKGKTYKASVKITDKNNAFKVSILKYIGNEFEAPTPEVLSYNNSSPVFNNGWIITDDIFITEDVINGVHTKSGSLTIPTDAKEFAIILYPIDSQIPTSLILNDFEGDITPSFNHVFIISNEHDDAKIIENQKGYVKTTCYTPKGMAALRYTCNSTNTKVPIGKTVGDKNIINDNSWQDAGAYDPDKLQGDYKFLVNGKVKSAEYGFLVRNEQSTVNNVEFWWAKINGDGSFTEIPNSRTATTIEANRVNPKIVMSNSFSFDVAKNDRVAVFMKSDKDDGFYIESTTDGKPFYWSTLVFDEEKEIPKNIVDLIEQNGIQFTKAGKPVDNPDKYSISIDVDTNKITVITK